MHLNQQISTLSNGIRVVSCSIPYVESAAVGFWIGVGGRYESIQTSGMSHFIEHLLFKGTETRSARDISEAIEGRGGYFNAFTQEDATCYYARISSDFVPEVLELLSDMYAHSLFAADDIEKERRVIVEEIMMYRDQPHHVVQEQLEEMLWLNHPLGRSLAGTPENVMGMSREQIVGFKEANYVPANTIISLAGNVDHDACVAILEMLLGGRNEREAPTYKPVSEQTPQDGLRLPRKKIEQAHLAMGVRLFGRADARRYPMKLLSVILGENMSSRLFQTVREEYGMAYSIHSGMQLYDDIGFLQITAGIDRERGPAALKLIVEELCRIRDEQVSERELKMAKDYASGQLRIGMEGTSSQMFWMGENMLAYGKIRQPQEIVDSLEKVLISDISEVAREMLKRERLSMALLIPDDSPMSENEMEALLAAL